MSLWIQSLYQLLNFNDNCDPKDNAQTVFAFLSMGVPRDWWDNALKNNNHVSDSHVYVLIELYEHFKKIPELAVQVNYKHLAAIAFADERTTRTPFWGRAHSEITVEEYIKKANEILGELPDVANLCSIIEARARVLIQQGLDNN